MKTNIHQPRMGIACNAAAKITIAVCLALQAASAAVSKKCTDEITALSKKSSFDMQEFMKDLPVAVVKAKVQAKMPFGKPKDGDKQAIGMTFGCLKAFPESPGEIQSLLKDISMGMAKGIAGNAAKSGSGDKLPKRETAERANVMEAERQDAMAAVKKDVISLQDGQELKDIIVTEIGIDEVKYKVGARVAIYVIKKSDIASILYADGAKDFFCGGAQYNSATHFCHADGKTYSCGDKPYDPARQACSNSGKVLDQCGSKAYDPATHFCHADGKTYSCGGKPYSPARQACSNSGQVLDQCGGKPYDPATHFCDTDGQVYALCGDKPYNPVRQACSNSGQVLNKCGNKLYNPARHLCSTDEQIYALCGDKPYDPATHMCGGNGKILNKCGNKAYNPARHLCSTDGQVYALCGDKSYDPETHYCDERFSEINRRSRL